MQNRRQQKNNKSGYYGVSSTPIVRGYTKYKMEHPWTAMINLDGKTRRIGWFNTAEEAARAYDTRAIELFGELARVNFPKSP